MDYCNTHRLDAEDRWHRLEWEHAAGLGTPFSGEAARYARQLAAADGRHPDTAQALEELLARWDQGMVTGRRERRMVVRLAAERAALPQPDEQDAAAQVAALPGAAAGRDEIPAGPGSPAAAVREPAGPTGDDDDGEEIFDAPGDDYYADAFEVIT